MKLGASILLNFEGKNTIIDFIHQAHDHNFSVVEIVAEPPFCYIDKITTQEKENIKRIAEKYNIELTIHATFSDINIAAINDNVRDFVRSEIKKNIEFAAGISATKITIHPGDYGAIGHSYPELTNQYNRESVEIFTKYAKKHNLKIGYENMPFMTEYQFPEKSDIQKIIELIREINSEHLGITWDIGHSHTLGYDVKTCYETFKNELIHIHLNDNMGVISGWRDTHLPIGDGTINWKEFFDVIKDYQSTMVFELSSWDKIEKSLEYISSL